MDQPLFPCFRSALLAGVVLALALPAARPARAEPVAPTPALAALLSREPLRMGTAWYPEQWPESRWDADLALMQAAHLTVVRVGEFAWSRMEPREGVFDFDWLDRAIAAASRHGIAVVLGTPTAAPPAWLTTAHPETLRIDENGVRDEHGRLDARLVTVSNERLESCLYAFCKLLEAFG